MRVERLLYDKETGIFVWRDSGKIAGSSGGFRLRYTVIGLDGKSYLAHRLAWFYVYDRWPTKQIDHIDGNGKNNAITNLREATASENQGNRRANRANGLGVKGVRKYYNKFQARIFCNGKDRYLGLFSTIDEAQEAYLTAAKLQFGDFSRGE